MGASDSRHRIVTCNLSNSDTRTLLYDAEKKQHIWKAKSVTGVSSETPVTFNWTNQVDLKDKPSAIVMRDFNDKGMEESPEITRLILDGNFQKITAPPLPETTVDLCHLNTTKDQKIAKLIWFRSIYPINKDYIFGFDPESISEMNIKSVSDINSFSHSIWILSFRIKGAYLAYRKHHFPADYQFKSC